jgi:hypothetical protein
MIAPLLFYLQEMAAALIFFAAFFVAASLAVLILYVLYRVSKRLFNWTEVHLKSFFRCAFRLYRSQYSHIPIRSICGTGIRRVLPFLASDRDKN